MNQEKSLSTSMKTMFVIGILLWPPLIYLFMVNSQIFLKGILGIICGVGGAYALAQFAGWNTLVSPEAVILAFGFSFVVGVFFGWYPARKAAGLDPIEALRYE